MQIQNSSHTFPKLKGSGPQVFNTTVTFPTALTKATAILTGFIAEFSPNDDHHLGQMDIEVSIPAGGVKGTSVSITVKLGLRDWSGNWDDNYQGQVLFSVIGE